MSWVVLALALATTLVHAAPPEPPGLANRIKSSFVHRAWTSREGAPQAIVAIAQGTDGWLWLGSSTGLYRFDGEDFEHVDVRRSDGNPVGGVRYLLAAADGDVWAAWWTGDMTRIRHGDPRAQDALPRMLPSPVAAFCETGDGVVFAASERNGLFELDHDRWTALDPARGLPADIESCMLSSTGVLEVHAADGVYALAKGEHAFRKLRTNARPSTDLEGERRGQIWTGRTRDEIRSLSGEGLAIPETGPPGRMNTSTTMLHARDGSLWLVNCDAGVCRAADDGAGAGPRVVTIADFAADTFTAVDGLTSDNAGIVYEDREGTIWVGTKSGLDSFRPATAWRVPFPVPQAQFAAGVADDGTMLVGTFGLKELVARPVWRIGRDVSEVAGFEREVSAIGVDRDGATYVAGPEGLWRYARGRFEALPYPPEAKGQIPRFVVQGGDGDLWTIIARTGLYRFHQGRWLRWGKEVALPDTPPRSMAVDAAGDLWMGFGFTDGIVVRVHGDDIVRHDVKPLALGPIVAVAPGEPLVVAGGWGLAAFTGGAFRKLPFSPVDVAGEITGMTRGADGSLWINTMRGLVHVAKGALDRALLDPDHALPARVYDADDGLRDSAQGFPPSVFDGPAGTIWVAGQEGLYRVDPAHLPRNDVMPPVAIRAVSSGTTTFDLAKDMHLPAGTRDLHVRFTALSLANPKRVRFKVRLDGLDRDWQAVGARREVAYSNLGPGRYVFHVAAANDDGVWNETGATVAFDIAPLLHETWWFRALVVVAVLLLLAALQRMHSRRLARRVALRERERAKERERLSRDLHDSLLQDMGALVLNLRGLQQRKASVESLQEELKELGQSADRLLVEARDRVTGLRAEGALSTDPGPALQAAAEQFAAAHPVDFDVKTEGPQRILRASVAEEFILIGREALSNAFRHAQASLITAVLRYDAGALVLDVTDDGIGLPEHNHKPGHWGLVGMRERADQLGATLAVRSTAGAGTTVALTLRADLAYEVA